MGRHRVARSLTQRSRLVARPSRDVERRDIVDVDEQGARGGRRAHEELPKQPHRTAHGALAPNADASNTPTLAPLFGTSWFAIAIDVRDADRVARSTQTSTSGRF